MLIVGNNIQCKSYLNEHIVTHA
uniref:Uncharacterized protein n=1 Tax=Anguilla anguilla TaxID=7936 RepID=A0A0E9SA76_ANGAN